MSPGRNDGAPYGPTPEPVVSVPDELDDGELINTDLAAAAGVVSIPGLVLRRVRWSLAPLWAAAARWIGQRAAAAARREAAARHALTVATYERKLAEARRLTWRWKQKAEAVEVENEFLTKLHVRAVARVEAETTATRAAEATVAARVAQ